MRGVFAIFILLIIVICGIATLMLMLRLFGIL